VQTTTDPTPAPHHLDLHDLDVHHLDSLQTSNLRPDGTVFPPVTPDPPAPPGYVSPLAESPVLDQLADGS
jgi:hypothetical protein